MPDYRFPSEVFDTEISKKKFSDSGLIILEQSESPDARGLAYKPIFLKVRLYPNSEDPQKVHLTFVNPSMTDFSLPHMRVLEKLLGVSVSCRQTGDESGEVNPVKVTVKTARVADTLAQLCSTGSKDPFCTAFKQAADSRVFISRKMVAEIKKAVADMGVAMPAGNKPTYGIV